MKHAVACDDDGHFAVVQLSDRKRLWTLLTEDVENGDMWRDVQNNSDHRITAHEFNALRGEEVEALLNETLGGRGRLEFLDIDMQPVLTQAVDKPALPMLIDDIEVKRRQWRKTTLAFAMAYPDWFGPENGMIGSDIVENALHVLDILPIHWVKHISSVNPNPNLKVEIFFEKDNGSVSMFVSRSGILYRIHKNDGTDIEGSGECTIEGLEEFNDAWNGMTVRN